MKVTVYRTLQSGTNAPVEVPWTRDDSPSGALAAIANMLHDEEHPDLDVPESVRARTLSIRVVIDEPPVQLHMTETVSTPNFKKFGNPDEYFVVCRCGWNSRDSFPLYDTRDEARRVGDAHLQEAHA